MPGPSFLDLLGRTRSRPLLPHRAGPGTGDCPIGREPTAGLSWTTNTVTQVIPTVAGMTTRTEVKAWLADQLPALLEKYDVPAAAVAVPHQGDEVVDDAAGTSTRRPGSTRPPTTVPDRVGHQAPDEHLLGDAAVDEGLVDLDVPVRTYPGVPDRDEQAAAVITTRMLLNHTGRGSRATSSPTPASVTTVSRGTLACSTRCRRSCSPGEQFSTTTPATASSAGLVEVLREKTYDACLREHLFAPRLTHAATGPYNDAIMSLHRHGSHRDGARRRAPARPDVGDGSLELAGGLDVGMRPRDLLGPSPGCTSRTAGGGRDAGARPTPRSGMQGREVDLPELGPMGSSWGLGFERFDTPDGAVVGHDGNTIGQAAFSGWCRRRAWRSRC